MATDQLSEQEIQFRKRARRRLVGAIALVLLMVTVLPMLLDDQEAKGPQQDIAISIPSQDGGDFSSKIVPATPAPPSAQQAVPEVKLASPLEKPHPESVAKPTQGQDTEPVASAPEKAQTSTPAKVLKEEAAKPVVPVEEAVAKTPAKDVQPPATAAEKPAAKKSGFSVQIGVFSDAGKVKQLQDKLAAQGVQTYTEKLNTPKGVKLRLRSGPFANRDDAEKVLDKLKALKMAGMVVENK